MYCLYSLCRKCRLVTTGPWKEVGTLPLLCVSLQTDPPSWVPQNTNVALWAVDLNGNVLCRLGVSRLCPQVRKLRSFSNIPAQVALHVHDSSVKTYYQSVIAKIYMFYIYVYYIYSQASLQCNPIYCNSLYDGKGVSPSCWNKSTLYIADYIVPCLLLRTTTVDPADSVVTRSQ